MVVTDRMIKKNLNVDIFKRLLCKLENILIIIINIFNYHIVLLTDNDNSTILWAELLNLSPKP